MGRQVLMKSDNNQIHFFLSDVSQGHSLMSKTKNECKFSSGLAGMARQLLPEGARRNSLF